MKLKKKVIIVQPIHEKGLELLKESVEEVIVSPDDSVETVKKLLDETVEGVIVRYNPFPRELMEKAPNLKVIGRHGIGVELIDLNTATEKGVVVVNTPEAATNSVAEHAVTLMLCLAKNILFADEESRKANYAVKNKILCTDLEGKILGIIGIGKIGLEVAKKCMNGFNMKVLAYDPFADKRKVEKLGISLLDDINIVLKEADFVSLHLPLTKDTKYSIGENEFKKMKRTAFLINCARGAVVNERELLKALKEGEIAGAGLDVVEKEPPDKDNPLLKLDNVVLTPHSASLTVESKIKMAVTAVEEVVKVLKGDKSKYLVNPEVWTNKKN